MPKISRLDVISTDARHRWTLSEKQRIVAESYAGRRLVSATARRNGLSASQLFTWRRLAQEGAAGRMEIVLAREHRVIVDNGMDAATLGWVIDVLERPR